MWAAAKLTCSDALSGTAHEAPDHVGCNEDVLPIVIFRSKRKPREVDTTSVAGVFVGRIGGYGKQSEERPISPESRKDRLPVE